MKKRLWLPFWISMVNRHGPIDFNTGARHHSTLRKPEKVGLMMFAEPFYQQRSRHLGFQSPYKGPHYRPKVKRRSHTAATMCSLLLETRGILALGSITRPRRRLLILDTSRVLRTPETLDERSSPLFPSKPTIAFDSTSGNESETPGSHTIQLEIHVRLSDNTLLI